MKLISTVFFMLCMHQFFAQQGNVGINTDTPEQKLHVNGSMKATDIKLDQNPYPGAKIPELTPNEKYSFLLKSTSANRITTYNVQTSGGGNPTTNFPAPFGIIQYSITTDNNDRDWVNAYDTKINATKYLVIMDSFNFNLPVVYASNSEAIRKLAPVAQVYTYEQGGTWWIKADYNGFAPPTNLGSGLWNVTLMIFDKTFARKFEPGNIIMNANTTTSITTGAAAAPLINK